VPLIPGWCGHVKYMRKNKKATEKGRILFAKMAMTPEKVAKIILKAIYRKNFWLLHPWI